MKGKCTTHPVITCNDQIVRKHVSENKNKIKVIMKNATIYFMLIDVFILNIAVNYILLIYCFNQCVYQNLVSHFNANFSTQALTSQANNSLHIIGAPNEVNKITLSSNVFNEYNYSKV